MGCVTGDKLQNVCLAGDLCPCIKRFLLYPGRICLPEWRSKSLPFIMQVEKAAARTALHRAVCIAYRSCGGPLLFQRSWRIGVLGSDGFESPKEIFKQSPGVLV